MKELTVRVELFKQAQSKLANTELNKSPPVKFEDLKSELYKIEQVRFSQLVFL